MAAVQLKHLVKRFDHTLYFYSGEVAVRGGVVTIPHDRPEWVMRAYILGFRLNPETGEEYYASDILVSRNIATEVDGHLLTEACPCEPTVESVPPVEAATVQSAESAEETSDEGTDGGRQPAGDDGVRTSEPAGTRRVRGAGVDRGSGDRPAVDGEGD